MRHAGKRFLVNSMADEYAQPARDPLARRKLDFYELFITIESCSRRDYLVTVLPLDSSEPRNRPHL